MQIIEAACRAVVVSFAAEEHSTGSLGTLDRACSTSGSGLAKHSCLLVPRPPTCHCCECTETHPVRARDLPTRVFAHMVCKKACCAKQAAVLGQVRLLERH
jgi:hypothetical protein